MNVKNNLMYINKILSLNIIKFKKIKKIYKNMLTNREQKHTIYIKFKKIRGNHTVRGKLKKLSVCLCSLIMASSMVACSSSNNSSSDGKTVTLAKEL